MQLSVTLLLVFVTGALTGPAPTEDAKPSTNRGQRLLFRPLRPVSKVPLVPTVVLVQQPQSSSKCPSPYSVVGCPVGYVCSAAYTCIPRKPTGTPCRTGYECLRGKCRNQVCVKDLCQTTGWRSGCQPHEYCTYSADGNICKAKKTTGEPCDVATQCSSNTCEHHRCVTNECELSSSHSDCGNDQYCVSSHGGNVCREKLDRDERCSADQHCLSGRCTDGYCYGDECLMPLRESEECHLNQICMATPLGNRCMLKLPEDASCTGDIQCLSGNCQFPSPLRIAGGVCVPLVEADPPLANGAGCDADSQCASGRCYRSECRPALLEIGEKCDFYGMDHGDDECLSNYCGANACELGNLERGDICTNGQQCESAWCTDDNYCV